MTKSHHMPDRWFQLMVVSFGFAAVLGGLEQTASTFAIIGAFCLMAWFITNIPTGITFSEADD